MTLVMGMGMGREGRGVGAFVAAPVCILNNFQSKSSTKSDEKFWSVISLVMVIVIYTHILKIHRLG